MSQAVAGTFASGNSAGIGQTSAELMIPSGAVVMKLTAGGAIDASNTVKLQFSTDGGQSWTDGDTYNTAQAGTEITVAHGEVWRLFSVAAQALKEIPYVLSVES